ncbi:hypothetical protein EDB81DRAFT_780337 [Dactylonectria macrodidyma]|uniref:Uncharacterized protein n=1 Tax=Dactylonectria macrodidyma TaxID=307937 RepID=A0A9P9FNE1_9HYPO|nr:hypothetical protein EDB81DRAFT_780337 [Dactylonectria macrodidyma]
MSIFFFFTWPVLYSCIWPCVCPNSLAIVTRRRLCKTSSLAEIPHDNKGGNLMKRPIPLQIAPFAARFGRLIQGTEASRGFGVCI